MLSSSRIFAVNHKKISSLNINVSFSCKIKCASTILVTLLLKRPSMPRVLVLVSLLSAVF